MNPYRIARAAELACILEVLAPKPGNVSRWRDFSDTTCEDFIVSAWAIGPVFASADRMGVGELILSARRATAKFVKPNTNLGIILLLAPLAVAAAMPGPHLLRERLQTVLDNLTVEDCSLAYTAIREANPGGLGRSPRYDVRDEPAISLLEAMRVAEDRDSIASEYVTCYNLTFSLVYPTLLECMQEIDAWQTAIVQTYLKVLATVPDTLIARKVGLDTAHIVSARAAHALSSGEPGDDKWRLAVGDLDSFLRADSNKRNPGTTADLVTASLFLLFIEHGFNSLAVNLESERHA